MMPSPAELREQFLTLRASGALLPKPVPAPRAAPCPKCGRPMVGWPLERPGRCSPAYWVNCIRV